MKWEGRERDERGIYGGRDGRVIDGGREGGRERDRVREGERERGRGIE